MTPTLALFRAYLRSRGCVDRDELFQGLVGCDPKEVLSVGLSEYETKGVAERLWLAASVLAAQGNRAFSVWSELFRKYTPELIYFVDALAQSTLTGQSKLCLFRHLEQLVGVDQDLDDKITACRYSLKADNIL